MSELKLTRDTWSGRKPTPTYTIEQAIEHRVDYNYGEHEGVAEGAGRRANEAARIIGELITLLHGKGTLTTEDVLGLVGSSFVEVKENK